MACVASSLAVGGLAGGLEDSLIEALKRLTISSLCLGLMSKLHLALLAL